ncbi:MAG TPA: GTPase-activating protein [Geobacterales bacterium]|nr:GTPase-activating protein [Geobacterales bacterium]
MFLLPKGGPVHENIAAARTNMPELFGRLKGDSFSGYARFTFPTSFGILLFESGKLISAMFESSGKRISGFEAMAGIFNQIVSDGGSLDVYRLSNDLTMCVHALLHGEVLYRGQELKLINIKGLLDKVKSLRLNGCLRIYTDERGALIFYKDGAPLGFFHDGSHEIETSASESQKIAGLPGAKIDVLSTKSTDELMHYDLLEMVNIDKLWESTAAKYAKALEKLEKEAEDRERSQRDDKLKVLEDDLKELATAYVGKLGKTLVEKELQEQGGRECLNDAKRSAQFLLGIERSAKLLISVSKLDEMLRLMKSEIIR